MVWNCTPLTESSGSLLNPPGNRGVIMRWNAVFNTAALILVLAVTPARADYEAGQQAWDAGQQSEAIAEWQRSAKAGDAKAMLALGRLYVSGEGVLQDYVQAYKWFNLAASRGEGVAVAERDALTAQMSLQERAEARNLALEWEPDSSAGGTSAAQPQVKEDMSAEAIREVQSILAILGYQPGPADGMWGQRTTQALQAFLRDSDLPPPDTLTESLRILRSTSQQTTPAQVGLLLLEPLQVKPQQVEPQQVEPQQVEPQQVEPLQVKPQQVESQQVESQPFTVIAEPRGARVQIVNFKEPYIAGMGLAPGEYEVEVSAAGYESVREKVQHGGTPTERRIMLVRLEPPRQAGERFRDCSVCPEVVVVPAGSFLMGSPPSEEGRTNIEEVQREVTISQPLAVGVYEVTFAEWDACVTDRGCNGHRPDDAGWRRGLQPVINVSWGDAQAYVAWLAEDTGRPYRLLSEAEWEYAARAGTQTPFHTGETITPAQANYDTNYIYGGGWKAKDRRRTIPVGTFQPNAFGLYDVHGNIWEWTQDCWNRDVSKMSKDGRAWEEGDCSRRVLRGGSWIFSPKVVRSASRNSYVADYRYYYVGFRVARTLPYLIPPGTDENGQRPETATLHRSGGREP